VDNFVIDRVRDYRAQIATVLGSRD